MTTTRRYTHVDTARSEPAITVLESAFDGERKRQQEKQERERAATAKTDLDAAHPQTGMVQ